MKVLQVVVITCVFLMVNGCSTLTPNFEKPTVKVVSIALLPGQSLRQGLEVGLLVSNPNNMVLDFAGMSYKLEIEGLNIADGVITQMPQVPAYGEAEVKVPVTFNIFNGLKLIRALSNKPSSEELAYRFEGKLDTGWALLPRLVIAEEGCVPWAN